jgi:hypothetical protein
MLGFSGPNAKIRLATQLVRPPVVPPQMLIHGQECDCVDIQLQGTFTPEP